MSLSEIVIKIIGLVLAVVGTALLLSVVGLNILNVSLEPVWLAIIVGIVFLGGGIHILRGGSVSL